jgi:N-acetyl sugar amidotransferase
MDETDPDIRFDADGVCNHCHTYDENVRKFVFDGIEGKKKLAHLVKNIKASRSPGSVHDCIMGVSGGVDSSFVAYKAKELGLSPVAIHLDNGWNTKIAEDNIRNLMDKLEVPLITIKADTPEFYDLQRAFLYASTPDAEIPTDHALFATMHQMATKFDVKYILGGGNFRTESHLPPAWSNGHFDWGYVKDVHRKYGMLPLKNFPHAEIVDLLRYPLVHKSVNILNLLDYNKESAIETLAKEVGWHYYGGKHLESIYTRWVQGYLLPKKFGIEKRKMHFSTLICSELMSREDALTQLTYPPYPVELQEMDKQEVMKRFDLSKDEFSRIMKLPIRKFSDFKSYENSLPYSTVRNIKRLLW